MNLCKNGTPVFQACYAMKKSSIHTQIEFLGRRDGLRANVCHTIFNLKFFRLRSGHANGCLADVNSCRLEIFSRQPSGEWSSAATQFQDTSVFRRPWLGKDILQKMFIVRVNGPRPVSAKPRLDTGGRHPAIFVFVRIAGLFHRKEIRAYFVERDLGQQKSRVEKKLANRFWL